MGRNNKIFVIGSNSFSGSNFVSFALDRGMKVFGLSRSKEPSEVFLPYKWNQSKQNFSFYPYDINHHLDEIITLVKTEKPAYIINFAAQSMVGESWENPEDWFRTNISSTSKLYRSFVNLDFLDRLIHVTTPEVYGSTEGFIREQNPFNPSTPYAVSRAAGDMSLKILVEAFGLPAVSTRAANVYGPGQQLYRIIPRAIMAIRLNHKIDLHGGGTSRRSFIHIDDVSRASWTLLEEGAPGETYHISTNEIVSIRDLVNLICDKMNVSFHNHVNVSEERIGKDAAYLLDSRKIRNEIGWSDEKSLSEGLENCISWVDKNLKTLEKQPMNYIHRP